MYPAEDLVSDDDAACSMRATSILQLSALAGPPAIQSKPMSGRY